MNKLNNHTRNQRRMYRIHKLEEKVKGQEFLIGTLQEKLDKINEYTKDCPSANWQEVCEDIQKIINEEE